MTVLARLRRALAARIRGTGANVAARKRKAEKELRAAGHSRSHARAIVAARFTDRA